MKDIFTEIGFGNETFLSTEVEEGDSEYRIKGFILPEKILEIYLRFYIGKRNIILSSKDGIVVKRKKKSKFKILFGIRGKSINIKNTQYGIIAIHGGSIEAGTGEIARAIAEDDFPLYINEKGPHITSTEFQNDELDHVLKQCDTIISIHGEKNRDEAFVIVGGLDTKLAQKIEDALFHHGFTERHYPHRLRGVDPLNVCNRGRSGFGVQLEISHALRVKLLEDKQLMKKFVGAVRNILLSI